jgi:hypothetical protein
MRDRELLQGIDQLPTVVHPPEDVSLALGAPEYVPRRHLPLVAYKVAVAVP